MARLKNQYNSEIKSALVQQFGYGNIMQVPHIEKVVLNMDGTKQMEPLIMNMLEKVTHQYMSKMKKDKD